MSQNGKRRDWRHVKLKDVCQDITVGHVGPMADQYVDSGITFLRSQNIEPFRLNLADVKFITPEFHTKLKKSALRPGDVVVVRTGYPGTACVIPRTLQTANCADFVVIRPSPDLDPWFLTCVFNSTWGRGTVAGNLVGVAQQHFNVGVAKEMTVDLPPPGIQKRISSILSAYDDLIENNTRRIQILERMAQALYREWFVEFRFPGHAKVTLVDSPLGKIPEDWKVVQIGDVCERVTDGSHSSPQSVDEGLPMASSKDMHDWGLTLETCRFISREDFDELARNDCKPKKNDVLITKDGANYLKRIFVNRAEQEVVLLSSIAILRPSTRVNPHLLAAMLSSPENKARLKNYVTGAAIPRIILKDFKRFQFALPSKFVQSEWAKWAEPVTELCWRLVDKNQNLRRTRDLLLPRLISGDLSVERMEAVA